MSGYHEYNTAQKILLEGRAAVVEGPITDFHTPQPTQKGNDRFTVNGVPFFYTDADLSNPGFKQQTVDGGPLRNGLLVRIHYYYDSSRKQNIILKLEIQE